MINGVGHMKKAYSLLEILVTITIIILLLAALFLIFNPITQINKSKDAKRKSDLATFSKVLEDFYNDKQCYPKPSEVCYDAPVNDSCHVCGNDSGSPSLDPYISTIICDPVHPTNKYIYNYDNVDCPKTYKIFAKLSITADPVIKDVGCTNGCGPSLSYNYGITSPNTGLVVQQFTPTNTPTPTVPTQGYCSNYQVLYYIGNNDCNVCDDYNHCKIIAPGLNYFIDGGNPNPSNRCKIACIKD